MSPSPTMVHEAGHAVVFLTFGKLAAALNGVSAIRTNTAAGSIDISVPVPPGEPDSWGAGSPALDARTEMALAVTMFGGMAAETRVRGIRPTQGWSNDLFYAILRLGRLGGANDTQLLSLSRAASAGYDLEGLANHAAVEFQRARVPELLPAIQALEEEAAARVNRHWNAVMGIANALSRAEAKTGRARLDRDTVEQLARSQPGWTTTPPPPLQGFYSPDD